MALKTVYGIDYINSDNDEFAGPLHAGGQGVTGEATIPTGNLKDGHGPILLSLPIRSANTVLLFSRARAAT